jgi:hypothetical protein
MLTKATTLKFYKREDIQQAMVAHAQNKEIGMRFEEAFGKRPDVLTYPRDVLELAKQGVTSLHASEERWDNPLALSATLTRKDLDSIRAGWDLVLDIDCKIMEYSRICADLAIRFLKYCGVKDVSCKFSGNKGFHIGVPFESFPTHVGESLTKDLFPEAPKKIAAYVTENIKEELSKRILEFEKGEFARVREKVQLPTEEIVRYEDADFGGKVAKLHVDKFLEIDTILIASRHLYRMPYSLHEKSGLVSLPIDPDKVMEFEKPMASPDRVLTPMFVFLDRDVEESARRLLVQALDFEVKVEEEREPPRKYEEVSLESPITEELFPDCIKGILNGLEDGKKRGLFCVMNFLGKVGWEKKDIEEYLMTWNREKNMDPLREGYIRGQLAHFSPGAKLPPNCDNDGYYASIGVKCKGAWCSKVKNPVNYTLAKWRRVRAEKKGNEDKV